MIKVFLVTHTHALSDTAEDVKLIGAFSTMAHATQAVK